MNYQPHEYQKYAIDFVETHKESALLLDLGLGKSSIALTAILECALIHGLAKSKSGTT